MGNRHTVQQRIIGEQLRMLGNHPTADDVYLAVSLVLPNISKATVYRTLHKMVDAGEAVEVQVGGAAERFDYRTDPHSHVICAACGRVDDVDAGTQPDLDTWSQASASTGYRITGQTLLYDGVCPACQQAEEKEVQ